MDGEFYSSDYNYLTNLRCIAVVCAVMFVVNVIVVINVFVRREARLKEVFSAVLYLYASGYLLLFLIVWQLISCYSWTQQVLQSISLSDLHLQLFDQLRIEGYECRLKFVCESTRLVTSGSDAVASFLKLVSTFGGFDGDYLSGALEGLAGTECSRLYPSCGHSPLHRTFPFLAAEPGIKIGT